jgi:TPR repeat protein
MMAKIMKKMKIYWNKKELINIVNIEQLVKSAEQGDAEAQYKLGNLCDARLDIPNNLEIKEPAGWYALAAEQGHLDSQYKLGNCYAMGWGVKTDGKKRDEWQMKAFKGWTELAEQGDAEAQYKLGICHHANGIYSLRDEKKSAEWYRKAAEQGHPWAQDALAYAYAWSYGVPLDKKKWKEWKTKAAQGFTKLAEQGDENAQFELGLCYSFGAGVKKDYDKAAEWFMKAAKQGHKKARKKMAEVSWIIQLSIKDWKGEDKKTAQSYIMKLQSFQYCPNDKKKATRLLPFIECKPLVELTAETVKNYGESVSVDYGDFEKSFFSDMIGYYYSFNLLVLYVVNEREGWEEIAVVLNEIAQENAGDDITLRILKFFEKELKDLFTKRNISWT